MAKNHNLRVIDKTIELRGGSVLMAGKKIPATVEIRLEDIDGDGDADVCVYLGGLYLGSIQFSTLASNVAAEVRRVRKRIRKAVKK